jgi:hypothetical protein
LKKREEIALRIPRASLSAHSMFWSPDGKWLAANVDTYPSSIVIYETATWKPVAQWPCEQIMSTSRFAFRNDGVFLALRDHDISGLDMTKSETTSSDKSEELRISEPDTTTAKPPPIGDKDFQDFQAKVKELVDPFRLQDLAIPTINQHKPGDILQPYSTENADLFRLTQQFYGQMDTDIRETKSNGNEKTAKFMVITCSAKDYHHVMGLVIGDKDFAGPIWGANYQVLSWTKGVYFWEDTRVHSGP